MTISDTRLRWASALAALFSGLILVQIGIIAFYGEPFCINTGCRVVEELVELDPMLFNMLGATYFALCALAASVARRSRPALHLFLFLCIAGLAAEGILIGYQAFVARTFCSYCLSVLGVKILPMPCGHGAKEEGRWWPR